MIFPAISDFAFLATGHKLENNCLAAVQTSLPMILGGRKNQPVPFQDLVGPVLGQDLITTIRIHFDGRRLALASPSGDFNTYAFIGSR